MLCWTAEPSQATCSRSALTDSHSQSQSACWSSQSSRAHPTTSLNDKPSICYSCCSSQQASLTSSLDASALPWGECWRVDSWNHPGCAVQSPEGPAWPLLLALLQLRYAPCHPPAETLQQMVQVGIIIVRQLVLCKLRIAMPSAPALFLTQFDSCLSKCCVNHLQHSGD